MQLHKIIVCKIGFATMKGSTVSLSGPGVSTLEQTGGHVYAQYRPGKFFVDAQLGVGRTNDRHDRQLTAWGMSASGSAGHANHGRFFTT